MGWEQLLAFVSGKVHQQLQLKFEYWLPTTASCETTCPPRLPVNLFRRTSNDLL